MIFIKSLWWVVSRAFGFLAVCGVFAGINADVPGVSDDPNGKFIINFLSGVFTRGLHILYNYPDGVVIGLIGAAIFHCFYTYPHAKKLRDEVKLARIRKRSTIRPKTGKKPMKDRRKR